MEKSFEVYGYLKDLMLIGLNDYISCNIDMIGEYWEKIDNISDDIDAVDEIEVYKMYIENLGRGNYKLNRIKYLMENWDYEGDSFVIEYKAGDIVDDMLSSCKDIIVNGLDEFINCGYEI